MNNEIIKNNFATVSAHPSQLTPEALQAMFANSKSLKSSAPAGDAAITVTKGCGCNRKKRA